MYELRIFGSKFGEFKIYHGKTLKDIMSYFYFFLKDKTLDKFTFEKIN